MPADQKQQTWGLRHFAHKAVLRPFGPAPPRQDDLPDRGVSTLPAGDVPRDAVCERGSCRPLEHGKHPARPPPRARAVPSTSAKTARRFTAASFWIREKAAEMFTGSGSPRHRYDGRPPAPSDLAGRRLAATGRRGRGATGHGAGAEGEERGRRRARARHGGHARRSVNRRARDQERGPAHLAPEFQLEHLGASGDAAPGAIRSLWQ